MKHYYKVLYLNRVNSLRRAAVIKGYNGEVKVFRKDYILQAKKILNFLNEQKV